MCQIFQLHNCSIAFLLLLLNTYLSQMMETSCYWVILPFIVDGRVDSLQNRPVYWVVVSIIKKHNTLTDVGLFLVHYDFFKSTHPCLSSAMCFLIMLLICMLSPLMIVPVKWGCLFCSYYDWNGSCSMISMIFGFHIVLFWRSWQYMNPIIPIPFW